MDPKVSIIIPVYNGEEYLAEAIECALHQTYQNTEVIVVNDGSTDNGETERIALSYGERIRYFCKENGGVSSALNFGIKKMQGAYFSWLSHDDGYSADKVKNSIELLQRHNQIGKRCISFTGGFFIDSQGKKIRDFKNRFVPERLYTGRDAVDLMSFYGTLNGCCMLIPRLAFEEVGFFDEALRYSQDSLMWYRLFLAGYSIISDCNNNVMYRLHRNQASQNRRDLYEHDALVIARLLAKQLSEIDCSGNVLFRYIRRLTKYQCVDAINYLCAYASENNVFNKSKQLRLLVLKAIGYFRYRMVSLAKKILILFRSRS